MTATDPSHSAPAEGAPAPLTVRYIQPVPATLKKWCDAHADRVQEVDCGEGYAFERRDGFAYDVLLRPGFRMADDCVHFLIENTVKAMLSQLRSVTECDCKDCLAILAKTAAKGRP